MQWFKIPVSWECYGVIQLEAETIEEAIKIFDRDIDEFDLPDANYVDGSFDRDSEEIIKLENNL